MYNCTNVHTCQKSVFPILLLHWMLQWNGRAERVLFLFSSGLDFSELPLFLVWCVHRGSMDKTRSNPAKIQKLRFWIFHISKYTTWNFDPSTSSPLPAVYLSNRHYQIYSYVPNTPRKVAMNVSFQFWTLKADLTNHEKKCVLFMLAPHQTQNSVLGSFPLYFFLKYTTIFQSIPAKCNHNFSFVVIDTLLPRIVWRHNTHCFACKSCTWRHLAMQISTFSGSCPSPQHFL